jgi:hypothetical protein
MKYQNIGKFLIIFVISLKAVFANQIDWKIPPVICPEDFFPQNIPCLDLSNVKDVYNDFPLQMSIEEINEWKNSKAQNLKLCRNIEVLRREKVQSGSYSSATIEIAWMIVNGGNEIDLKLDAVKNATLKFEMPPQILLGAMKQESLFANLGISPDGGNYSCGISQLNIQEWCNAINELSEDKKNELGWPQNISCNNIDLPTDLIKPLYDIAKNNLGNRKEYELNSVDFENVKFEQVVNNFPAGSDELQFSRFKAAKSFVNHCQDLNLSINFKASTLARLFRTFVPQQMQNANIYSVNETYNRKCVNSYSSKAYPLHTGWLMAVAIYNAGEKEKDLVDYYFQIKENNYFNLSPLDLIEALHWGGKYNPESKNIKFENQNHEPLFQSWFKSCIVQRHVARVIQYATLPGFVIANSLEQAPCKSNGEVPVYRQITSGLKN